MLVESSTKTETPPRAVFYVNRAHLPPFAFEQISLSFSDAIAIKIHTAQRPTLIINLYNLYHQNQLIAALTQYIQHNVDPQQYGKILIMGDFNLHYPL
jgi:hypothetical protein